MNPAVLNREMLFLHSSRTLMVFMQAGMCLWKVFISAVRAAGMEGKVTLACNDLGNNVAREIASGNIAGGGAQMPYDQGVAEAKLAALALLGEETPSYVAVPAETVTHENVLEAYTDVYHVETPDWLKEAYVE